MRAYWDERARLNAAWYVDTSIDYADPDMDEFFDAGDRIVDHVMQRLPTTPTQDSVALEIGAGLGRLCRSLKRSFGHVIGVDISPEMVERAKSLVPECEFRVNTGSTLDGIESGSVDLVLTFTVFQHIPVPDVIHGYVAEVARVLKPGGATYLQWNGSDHPVRWRVRRWLSHIRYRSRWGGAEFGTRAPEFQGTVVKPVVMSRWLAESGLRIVESDGLGSLWAQVWAVKDEPAREVPLQEQHGAA